MGRKRVEIKEGQRFNRLTIIKELEKKGSKRQIFCKCDCGGEWIGPPNNLTSNHTKSCGCLSCVQHGLAKHYLYGTWRTMKHRCYNPNSKDYYSYGGRGIKVCDRWLNSFPNFLEDMGDRPDGYTLDRINSDGNYEPDNCRWATASEQNNNRRSWSKKKNKNQLTLTLD